MKELTALGGKELNLLAVSCANAVAAEMDDAEIGIYAAFFTLVGDALAMLAIARPSGAGGGGHEADGGTR